MTTEDDFQRALDAQPDDWQTRLVFADWLDERDDPRGPGYRALGRLERHPYPGFPPTASGDGDPPGKFSFWGGGASYWHLPSEWRALMPDNGYGPWGGTWGDTRSEIEDAAALAFAKLPAERRAELLAPVHSSSS